MKILLLSPHFAEYSLQLAKALAAEHEVVLVLNRTNAGNELPVDWARQLPPALRVVELEHNRKPSIILKNLLAYRRLFREFRPDVIHCQEEPKDYLVAFLATVWFTPVVMTVHDPKPHAGLDAKRLRWSRLRAYKRFMRWRASGILVHGEALRQEALASGQFRHVPIASMPHGPLGVEAANVAADLAVPARCLFFGRIEAYKGLGVLVEAVETLRARAFPVQVVVAGRGTDLARWRPRMDATGAFTVIDRYITAAEVQAEFAACNLVLLPYLEATQSGVAAYALGVGRGIVGTDVGSLPDMIRPGVNGLLVKPGDAAALAGAIEAAVQRPDHGRALGQASLALGRGELSWHVGAAACRAVYEECLGQAPRRPAERLQ